MALEIGVGVGSSREPDRDEPSLLLDDDGYYWFLSSLIGKLHIETGQYVDLYGYARFAGEALTAMERMLAEARSLAASQPEEWQVHVGTNLKTGDLYRQVERSKLFTLLDQWSAVVRRARELSRPVVCFGD